MGGRVSILARNDERLLSAKAEIEQCISHPSSASVLCVTIDVAAPFEDVNNAVTYAEKLLGPVYLLANSAGYCRAGAFEDLTMDDFHVSFFMFWVFIRETWKSDRNNENDGKTKPTVSKTIINITELRSSEAQKNWQFFIGSYIWKIWNDFKNDK